MKLVLLLPTSVELRSSALPAYFDDAKRENPIMGTYRLKGDSADAAILDVSQNTLNRQSSALEEFFKDVLF